MKFDLNILDMMQHSIKDYHVKGFDYLCLKRTPEHTVKVYFFDGNVSQLPEVVNPHDHRYHFKTTVLTGVMSNSHYVRDEKYGDVFNEFEWNTPLNGGDGFKFKQETRLREFKRYMYTPGEEYIMKPEEYHTIRMHREGTIIMLEQFADVVPIGKPTTTFMPDKQAPNMDGLYSKFTPDEIVARVSQLRSLTNGRFFIS